MRSDNDEWGTAPFLEKLLEKKITLCYLYIMEHTLSKENNPIINFLLLRNSQIFTNEEKEDSVS